MATIRSPFGYGGAPSMAHLRPVVAGLGLAAALELLILRTLTRTAIHIPAMDALATPYEAVSFAGRYAYYVAAVLLMVALPLAAIFLWSAGDLAARGAACGIGLFIVTAGAARVVGGTGVDFLTVAALGIVAAASAGRLERRAALGLMTFATASLFLAGHTLLQSAVDAAAFDAGGLLYAGEIAAVVFALSAPWTMRAAPGRTAVAVATGVGIVTFAMLVTSPSTSKVLLLWNEGLSGGYPALLYAAAAGAVVATAGGLAARGQWVAAIAFALLVFGGFGLHNTYQTGLAVAGIATLAAVLGPVRAPVE